MVNRALVVMGLAIAALGVGIWLSVTTAQHEGVASGRALYAEYCAQCHGAALEGQPDWMTRNAAGRLPAPPHDETGHTWHHSDKQLVAIIKGGLQAIAPGYENDMPVFGDLLTDQQIAQVLDYIRSTWPPRAREYQQARSEADS